MYNPSKKYGQPEPHYLPHRPWKAGAPTWSAAYASHRGPSAHGLPLRAGSSASCRDSCGRCPVSARCPCCSACCGCSCLLAGGGVYVRQLSMLSSVTASKTCSWPRSATTITRLLQSTASTSLPKDRVLTKPWVRSENSCTRCCCGRARLLLPSSSWLLPAGAGAGTTAISGRVP